jgi:hypothetical protein
MLTKLASQVPKRSDLGNSSQSKPNLHSALIKKILLLIQQKIRDVCRRDILLRREAERAHFLSIYYIGTCI